MIIRNFSVGDKIDVAGLNRINVLVDRSEAAFVEIGYNEWPNILKGPPHLHEEKDQVFFVLQGIGKVVANGKAYPAIPGNIIHLPACTQHQTISESNEPLGYLLLNIFNSTTKEGHRSFAEHLELVKETRSRQAQSQQSGFHTAKVPKPKFGESFFSQVTPASGEPESLLDFEQTDRFALYTQSLAHGDDSLEDSLSGIERALFIISGAGRTRSGKEDRSLEKGDLVFYPEGTSYEIQPGPEGLSFLRLDAHTRP
mgnify:FL=1